MILNSQGKFQNVNYMQYYNSFEQGMITNPVIQGVAVGGVIAVAIWNDKSIPALLADTRACTTRSICPPAINIIIDRFAVRGLELWRTGGMDFWIFR